MIVLSTCIKTKGQNSDINDYKISIPRIHCAYEDSKHLLELLRDAFLLESRLIGEVNKILSNLINSKQDDKLRCIELVLLDRITSMCVHYNERTNVEELAKKYVCEVNQWQPIVEKGLSFTSEDTNVEFKNEIR